jgi:hypothetical protein
MALRIVPLGHYRYGLFSPEQRDFVSLGLTRGEVYRHLLVQALQQRKTYLDRCFANKDDLLSLKDAVAAVREAHGDGAESLRLLDEHGFTAQLTNEERNPSR